MQEKYPYNNYGKLMILLGILLLVPLALLPFQPDQSQYSYTLIIPSIASIILGALVSLIRPRNNAFIKSNVNYTFLVLFAWCYCFVLGALPYFLYGKLNFVQSLFESVSGYTTTGLSVITPSETPALLLFHRAFSQYWGGVGIILIFITVLKDKSATDLFNTEGHGDKFMTNIRKTAWVIFFAYGAIALFGAIGFKILGMNTFDAICHSLCSLSTGGFTTHDNGYVFFNSSAINLFSALLMLIGATNITVILMLVRGKIKQALNVTAYKVMIAIVGIFTLLATLVLVFKSGFGPFEGFVQAFCNVISCLSTCGNFYCDINILHPFIITILIISMMFGGCTGSTAGGIKTDRIAVILKNFFTSVKAKITPSNQIISNQITTISGRRNLSDDITKEAYNYLAMYLFCLITGTLLLMLTTDYHIWECLFEFTSCMSTVGSSVGITNVLTNNITLIIEIIGMFLGRLEIYILVVGVLFAFKGIKNRFTKRLQ